MNLAQNLLFSAPDAYIAKNQEENASGNFMGILWDNYENLWEFVGIYGNLWEFLWESMGIYGNLWEWLWETMGNCGNLK